MSKTFTTSRGVEVSFLSIAPLLEKVRASHPIPEPPTYEVKTAAGPVERHAHDETTLETDADKAAWAAYVKERDAAQDGYNRAVMRTVLLRGLTYTMPEGDAWVKEQEFIGIAVPTDPLARRLHWLETEALGSVDDYIHLMTGVMEASGVSQEVLTQVEGTFRGNVERNAAEGSAPSNGKVGGKREVRAGAHRVQTRRPPKHL